MLWASRYAGDRWLVLVRQERDLLIATASAESAYECLLNGEQPSLMLCEAHHIPSIAEKRKSTASKRPMRNLSGCSDGSRDYPLAATRSCFSPGYSIWLTASKS